MKHFISAVLTGLLFAIVGFSLIVSVDLNLDCRDCNGVGGTLLLILVVGVAGCFIMGLIVGGMVSRNCSRDTDVPKEATTTPEVFLNSDTVVAEVQIEVNVPDVPTEPATYSPGVTRAKIVIALFLVAIILIAFFIMS